MFGWLKRRPAAAEIPQPLWDATLAAYPFLAERSAQERHRLRELAGQFLAQKEFHGAGGLEITDAMALAIAAQAVLPVLHLGLGWYDDFVGVVVHPGEAMDGGPVMLSWSDVAQAGESAEHGYNVVVHEFIHKIDLRDGVADGCPPLRSRAGRTRWRQTVQSEYERFREQVVVAERFGGAAPWLDAYGATAVDEFFAVACEAYFVNRPRFSAEFPALVPLFDGFFQG